VVQEAQAEIVVRPVRWRIVLAMTFYFPIGATLGALLIRLIYGDWAADLRFSIACWLVAGLVVGIIIALRQRPIRLSATDLEAPTRWGGMQSVSRSDIDPVASGRRSQLDLLLLRDVVRSRRGERFLLSRWWYTADGVRRLEDALGISVRGDGRGV
jgi:hypothetical protein